MVIFNFNTNSDLSEWRVVDDTVMGGRSAGNIKLNSAGHALFHGDVSLENNGGFSSLRHRLRTKQVNGFETIKIRLKGDGKSYQFRVKSHQYDRHSYIYHFQTTDEWETIEVPLAQMVPKFRGRLLNLPNYPGQVLEEIAFLIGNKRAEAFSLVLESIILD